MNDTIKTVDIQIGNSMYGRFEHIKNTPSHVLAEFVDNALQSCRDHRSELEALEPGYHLCVEINFEWDAEGNASKIIVRDNAAGIHRNRYVKAFMPAAKPDSTEGLNEFGMGLKTAALWLGSVWEVSTTALGEGETRLVQFNLDRVISGEEKELAVQTSTSQMTDHGTTIIITSPTKNAPNKRNLRNIKEELASIYRLCMRSDELRIIVQGDELFFDESAILIAPFYKTLEGSPIMWKKDIDITFGKYKAKGFIAILATIDSKRNGLVLFRRGRAIIGAGADEQRYYPKIIFGSPGNFRYKRLFGELELEGFNVAFNKNDVQDRGNLEALMEVVKDEIRKPDFNLYAQAEEYRLPGGRSSRGRTGGGASSFLPTTSSTTSTQPLQPPSTTPTTSSPAQPDSQFSPSPSPSTDPDSFEMNGKQYKMEVGYEDGVMDFFRIDASRKKEQKFTCLINKSHPFFRHFGEPTSAIEAILKTLAIAKQVNRSQEGSVEDLFTLFNDYINKTTI